MIERIYTGDDVVTLIWLPSWQWERIDYGHRLGWTQLWIGHSRDGWRCGYACR